MSSDGSVRDSPRCAATSGAASPTGVKPAFEPEAFRARIPLLRRGDTLTDSDRVRLELVMVWMSVRAGRLER